MTTWPPSRDGRAARITRTITAHPIATAGALLGLLAVLLLVWVPISIDGGEGRSDVLTWLVIALFVFDAAVVWLLPEVVRQSASQAALPLMVFAAAPGLTSFSVSFSSQPSWLFATGFSISAFLLVGTTQRIRADRQP